MKKFNIEKHFDSLPADIEIINVSFKCLTYFPLLKRFYKLKFKINLFNVNIA